MVRGIDSALAQGLQVKLNTVLIKGVNEHMVVPVLNFARIRGITVRFLELMSMGHLCGSKVNGGLYSSHEIVQTIERHAGQVTRVEREKSSTATYYRLPDGYQFGIIANHSHPFCGDCNRLRLDSMGNLFGCISAAKGINIRPWLKANKEETQHSLVQALAQAMKQKQTQFTGSPVSMKHLGG
ncbi:MAG: hypothetical protein HC896_04655 [Bacteroidales bacterium]|nr:hypothetical protein [Bacteroidales bacterium]